MKHHAWTQFGMLLGEGATLFASGLVTYMLMSRWGGPVLVGQYSVVLAWIVLFQGVASFGLPELAARELARAGEDQGKYLLHTLVIGLAASVVAMVGVAAFVGMLQRDPEMRIALLLGTMTLAPALVDAICRGGFLAARQTEWILVTRIVEMALVVPVNAYLILRHQPVHLLMVPLVAGKIAASLLGLYLLNRYAIRLRPAFDARFCRRLLPPAVTFWMSQALGVMSTRVTVIMLSWWAPMAAVGLYAAAAKVVEVMLIIPVMFAHFMLPRLAAGFARPSAEATREHEGLLQLLFSMTIPLSIGVLFFARPVMHVLFGDRFDTAIPILRLLAIFFLVETVDILTSVTLKAAGYQKTDLKMYVVNPLANLALGAILIPTLGVTGAAVTRIASGAASCSLRCGYLSRRLGAPGWSRMTSAPFVVSGGLGAVLFAMQGYIPDVVLGVVYASAAAALLYAASQLFPSRLAPAPGPPAGALGARGTSRD